jgi:hypothetical protein
MSWTQDEVFEAFMGTETVSKTPSLKNYRTDKTQARKDIPREVIDSFSLEAYLNDMIENNLLNETLGLEVTTASVHGH